MGKRGKLIVIEGLDGSGKATQSELLARHIADSGGPPARRITFPNYESESSALIKMYLSGQVGTLSEVNAYAASIFYAADRYISYRREWGEAYRNGTVLVADRYVTSNAAHQMSKLPPGEWDDYLSWLQDLEYTRMELPRPVLVVYLDMRPETSRKLLEERYGGSGERDLHEGDLRYLQRCREAALYAAGHMGWNILPCCDGTAPLPIEDIARTLTQITEPFWKDPRRKGTYGNAGI